jgi:protein phosphatase inhibitor 2
MDSSLPAKKVKWDEEAIQEHDKERGTRTQIQEPKTPFRYASESESDFDESYAVSEGDLNKYLIQEIKKQEFKQKRKSHYDEYIRIKRIRDSPSLTTDEQEAQDQDVLCRHQDSENSNATSGSESLLVSSEKSSSPSKQDTRVLSRTARPLKPALKQSGRPARKRSE